MGLAPPSGARSQSPTSRRLGLGTFLALLVAVAAQAADPFYLRLLRQGTDAYNRRDLPTAVRDLRVACFGLLSEPELLADGLTRLALAQDAVGDEVGFRETFQRLAEVEERFSGYARANIPKDVRAAFEQLVLKLIPHATLLGIPVFAHLVPTREDGVAKLPLPQRRKELERLIKSEPRELKWRLMLAELELADGEPRAAFGAADGAAKLSPGSKEALRLRGLALVAEKKWPEAVDDLKASGAANSDPEVAGSLLSSLIELKRWQEASDLAVQLPADVARDRTVQQLSRSAADGLKASGGTMVPTPTRTVAAKATAPIKPVADTPVAGSVGATPTATPEAASKPTAGTIVAGVAGATPTATPTVASKPTVGTIVAGVVGATPTATPTVASKPTVGTTIAGVVGATPTATPTVASKPTVGTTIAGVVGATPTATPTGASKPTVGTTIAGVVGATPTAMPTVASKPTVGTTVAGVVGATPTATPEAVSKPTAGAAGAIAAGALQPPPTKTSGQPADGDALVGSGTPVPDRKPEKPAIVPSELPGPGRVQDLVRADKLDEAFTLAQKIADAYPDLARPQHVAAEMAYRISCWEDAVEYFRRGGDPGDGQPLLLFYEAVSLYETGDRAGASVALKRCLPNIRRTPYVENYVKKILGSNAPVSQNP